MCGRFADDDLSPEAEAWRATLAALKAGQRERFGAYRQRRGRGSFDVRPTEVIPVLTAAGLQDAAWGWVRDFASGGRLINARWETATAKPTFRQAVEQRRCAVLASAYYEWRRDDRDRPLAKYAFRPARGGWFAMAGLWEAAAGQHRFLVLTRAMGAHADIHDRTPVMLAPGALAAWLDPTAPIRDVLAAAAGMGDADLVVRPVVSGPNRATPAGAHLLASTGEPWPWPDPGGN